MNSNEIFNVIESIGSVGGKLQKQAIVTDNIDNPEFVRVLKYAYDPFITFGVASKTLSSIGNESVGNVDGHFDLGTWVILDRLSKRELSGTDAAIAIGQELLRLSEKSSELLRRILLKDLRAGFGESTINKAKSGTIPEFAYMRCSLPDSSNIDKFDWAGGAISQEKADGMFVNVNHDVTGDVSLLTRQGTPVPLDDMRGVAAEVQAHLSKGTQTHGELLVYEGRRALIRQIGNGILNSLLKGGRLEPQYTVHLHVWDQVPLEFVKPKGKYEVTYEKRLRNLISQLPTYGVSLIELVATKVVYSMAEAVAHCNEFLAKGKEGTVLKSRDAIWRDGTSKDQIKFKLDVDVDLRVVGFLPGEGKNAATFGSILCETEDGLLRVAVSGFTDKERARIHAEREQIVGMIETVKANEIMTSDRQEKHSLFLPRHVEFRMDKSVADTYPEVLAQFNAAKGIK